MRQEQKRQTEQVSLGYFRDVETTTPLTRQGNSDGESDSTGEAEQEDDRECEGEVRDTHRSRSTTLTDWREKAS